MLFQDYRIRAPAGKRSEAEAWASEDSACSVLGPQLPSCPVTQSAEEGGPCGPIQASPSGRAEKEASSCREEASTLSSL